MESIEQFIKGIDENILGILITSLIAFISWLAKGLIETPLLASKEVFYKFLERRIELLSELKVRLSLIAYFPLDDGNEFKEQIQSILLKDGKAAYLDNDMLNAILKISIDPNSDEQLILGTIKHIDEDLKLQIGKIQESNQFFNKYSNTQPSKRIVSFLLLTLSYLFTIGAIFIFIILFIRFIVFGNVFIQIISSIVALSILYALNKWITK
ncbi:MAG: hypothetical protein ABI367_02775 [Mucilaginibacter sp.]